MISTICETGTGDGGLDGWLYEPTSPFRVVLIQLQNRSQLLAYSETFFDEVTDALVGISITSAGTFA